MVGTLRNRYMVSYWGSASEDDAVSRRAAPHGREEISQVAIHRDGKRMLGSSLDVALPTLTCAGGLHDCAFGNSQHDHLQD